MLSSFQEFVSLLIIFYLRDAVACDLEFKNLNATISVESSLPMGKLVFTLTTSDEYIHPSEIILKTGSEYFEVNPADRRKVVVKSCLPAGLTEVLEFSLEGTSNGHNDNGILTINISPVTPIFNIPADLLVPVHGLPNGSPRIVDVLPIEFYNAGKCTSFQCNVTCTNDEKHFWVETGTNLIRTFLQDLTYDFEYELEIECTDASGAYVMPASTNLISVVAVFTDTLPGANESVTASYGEDMLRFQKNSDILLVQEDDQYGLSGEDTEVAMLDNFDNDGAILGRHKRDVTTASPGSNVGYTAIKIKTRCFCSSNFPRLGPNGFFIRKYRPVKVTHVTVLASTPTATISNATSTLVTSQPTIENTTEARTSTESTLPSTNAVPAKTITTSIVITTTLTPSSEPTTKATTKLTTTAEPKTTETTKLTTTDELTTTETTKLTTTAEETTTETTTLTTTDEPTTTERTKLTTTDEHTTKLTTIAEPTTTKTTKLTSTVEPTTSETSILTTTVEPLTTETTKVTTGEKSSNVPTTIKLTSTKESSTTATTKLTTTEERATATSTKPTTTKESSPATTTKLTTVDETSTVTNTKLTPTAESTSSKKILTTTAGPDTLSTASGVTGPANQQPTGTTSSLSSTQTHTNKAGTTNNLHTETPDPGFFEDLTNVLAIIGGGGLAVIGLIGSVIYKVLLQKQCRSAAVGTSSTRDDNNLRDISGSSEPGYSGTVTSSNAALISNEGGMTPVG